ncbi:5-dehydro-4-deoxyglucarate dehydratase [Brevibacterium sp.]|uniref:5-dehydro-4-deoxyglucarate dehydratase n=1 Tax=Brevibacterium sp. TaxID=1701 RepID=UPI0028121347|nr:5-dehydro-4-deoxyglucarate dehydratase [Brevibacterium sp.]
MTDYAPTELANVLKNGLLSFPVTPFDDSLAVDENTLRKHLEWQSSFDVAGLFVAGGTGEGFSLTPEEASRVSAIAVDTVRDGVPVLGSATGNTAQAIASARAAEEAGVDGLLLLPPYLTETTQEGLFAHVSAVLEATSVSVIIYNRANAHYSAETVAKLAEKYPHFIGFKDANGEIEHLARVRALNGDRLIYIGGLPTAETYALPLLKMGLSTYSSAMFNFIPEFALDFYAAVRAEDEPKVNRMISDFVLPYLDIRNLGSGYGVSIVKAGLNAVGRPVGSVRPPLRDLSEAEQDRLATLLSGLTN